MGNISSVIRSVDVLALPENQAIFVTTTLNRPKLAKVLHQQVRCLVTILGTDNLSMSVLTSMTKTIKHHVIFKLGGRKPVVTELKESDRPFVWIEVEDKPLIVLFIYFLVTYLLNLLTLKIFLQASQYNIHLHCPKENHYHAPQMRLKHIWKQGRESRRRIIACPSRLAGRNITLAYAAKFRVVNIGGKKYQSDVHGHMYLYLAEMFQFTPNFEQMNFHVRGTWT